MCFLICKRNINILIVRRKYVHHRPARTDLLMYYCCRAITATGLLNYAVPGPKHYYSLSYLTDDSSSTSEVMVRNKLLQWCQDKRPAGVIGISITLYEYMTQTHSLGFDIERIGPDEAG